MIALVKRGFTETNITSASELAILYEPRTQSEYFYEMVSGLLLVEKSRFHLVYQTLQVPGDYDTWMTCRDLFQRDCEPVMQLIFLSHRHVIPVAVEPYLQERTAHWGYQSSLTVALVRYAF